MKENIEARKTFRLFRLLCFKRRCRKVLGLISTCLGSNIFPKRMDRISSLDRINELCLRQIIAKKESHMLTKYLLAIQKTRLFLILKRKGQFEGIEKSDLPEIEALLSDKAKTEKIFTRIELNLHQ